ncbi:hypothetical protein DSM104443_00541 [Usitatibacter rugosus]|uniref:Uncharacterized protein n=1 Tax=Usitatibacter rugosus TaxID=2732067 RepID=A0A6M4GV39_9PROT|nr:hypothetical protein [Usitatibacter rugosus]QJR09497.1 hypothetical protein DSM104443_00541 [Usitatibacter rugosus]
MNTLPNDPADPLRAREKEAVHNVRALVDELERDESRRRKRVWYLLAALIPFAFVVGIVLVRTKEDPARLAADQTRACELAWWAANSGKFEREMREANPGMPNNEIGKKLEKERPSLMATAKTECNSTAKK